MNIAVTVDQIASVSRLHRHSDGVISFAVKSDDLFCPIFAVRAGDLETVFPEFREHLFKNSYVSINAAVRMAKRSMAKIGTPKHNTGTLRYLCASYVDIDCHTVGISCGDVLRFAKELVTLHQVPPWSGVVYSGRGMWLLWLLNDASNPELAHLGAYPDNPRNHLQLYARVGEKLRGLLASVGADPAASDAARYIRLPGSFRTDIEVEVVWEWEDTLREKPNSYALIDLAERLGVLEPLVRRARTARDKNGKYPLRRRGREAANQNRLAAFRVLEDVRGGFKEGMRANAAFILSACLRQTGHGWSATVHEMECFRQNCVPALPAGECLFAVKSAFKKNQKPMRYQWIADTLAVTVTEAKLISELLGNRFPPAVRFSDGSWCAPLRVDPRKIRRVERQVEIRAIVEQLGFIPSVRQLERLLGERGVKIGHVTITADLKEMCLAPAFPPQPPSSFFVP
jgi:hypothetical protein